MVAPSLKLVPASESRLRIVERCRFKFVHKQGRGSNRRAIYVCVAHAYPSDCLLFATKVTR